MADVSAAANIFIWPAIRDGCGIALLEAKAAGLPVAVGYTPGLATIILDGETGILRPQGDGQAFAAALHRLLHDAQMRETMDDAANRNALQ